MVDLVIGLGAVAVIGVVGVIEQMLGVMQFSDDVAEIQARFRLHLGGVGGVNGGHAEHRGSGPKADL